MHLPNHIVSVDVLSLKIRKEASMINIASDHSLAQVVRISVDGECELGYLAQKKRIDAITLHTMTKFQLFTVHALSGRHSTTSFLLTLIVLT